MKGRAWYLKIPGYFYVLGPLRFEEEQTEEEVRKYVLRVYYPERKRLPVGVDVYPTND